MNAGSVYVGAERELYADCLQLVPALAKLRAAGNREDGFTLLVAMLEEADAKGVPQRTAWSIMSTATMTWLLQMTEALAGHHQRDVAEELDAAIAAVTHWAATGE